MGYINYNDIVDIPLIEAQSDMGWPSNIPWVNSEKIIGSGIYNITTQELDELDILWWNTTITWTANNYRRVSWSSWAIYLPSWQIYNISSGDTGNISSITYVYLDINISLSVLQKTTTASDSVWPWKLLLCVVDRNSDTSKKAIFQAFGSKDSSTFITADNIASNSITANEIASNSITANRLNVSTLSAISANLGTVTAWTITWATIQTASNYERTVLNSGWFVYYDDYNKERLRLTWQGMTFYDSDGDQSWVLYWGYWYLVTNSEFICNWFGSASWWEFGGAVIPSSSWSYNLWISSKKRRNLYLSGNVLMDWHIDWVSYMNFTNKINFGSAWASIQTGTTTSNRYIKVFINSTELKLLLAT